MQLLIVWVMPLGVRITSVPLNYINKNCFILFILLSLSIRDILLNYNKIILKVYFSLKQLISTMRKLKV